MPWRFNQSLFSAARWQAEALMTVPIFDMTFAFTFLTRRACSCVWKRLLDATDTPTPINYHLNRLDPKQHQLREAKGARTWMLLLAPSSSFRLPPPPSRAAAAAFTGRPLAGRLLPRFRHGPFLLLSLLVCTHGFKAALPIPGVSSKTCPTTSTTRMAASSIGSTEEPAKKGTHGTPISRIGFGTYRVGASQEHARAIREALLHGVTLVDTSANYMNGDAERTIGRVVRELMKEGKLQRQDVLLMSKYGYIQGQNYERYESGEVVTPDTVHYAPGLKHCVHPAFMRDQLSRSLERLGLPGLDVFLLHNPEYYLTHSVKPGVGTVELGKHRAEMERSVFQAFKALEAEIATGDGRLQSYGISSNSFSLPPGHPHFLRYDNLVELAERAAREVSGDAAHHHFSTIQLPANLVEQEGLDHAVKWAEAQGLVVLVNRPLNAFDDERGIYLRLAEYADATEEYDGARAALLGWIGRRIEAGDERYQVFRAEVERVHGQLLGADNVLAWDNVAGRVIVPALRRGLEATADGATGQFDEEAVALVQRFLAAAEHQVKHRSGVEARRAVETKLGFGPLPQGKSLQEFAVEWLLGKPGVTCVLLGCRNKRYVEDAIKLVQAHPPVREL